MKQDDASRGRKMARNTAEDVPELAQQFHEGPPEVFKNGGVFPFAKNLILNR